MAEVPNQITHQGRANVPSMTRQRDRLYAAERRFDLITVLTITTGYAVLFTLMRLLHWDAIAFAVVAGFVTLVGVGQAFLFKGNAPRAASALVGAVYWALINGAWASRHNAPAGAVLSIFLGSTIQGALVGYVCGVLVGGVFMLADFLRRHFGRPLKEPYDEADSDLFMKDE